MTDSQNLDIITAQQFNVIVIGAGAAGCALAARLSEDPERRVLLIEAGPDMPKGEEPKAVRNPFPGALNANDFTWEGMTAEVFPARNGRAAARRKFIQAKVMGGASTINGMMAQRGVPWDFDAWAEYGAENWGWDDVLPYFNALEHDLDFGGPSHGKTGPIPIRREKREDWAPFAEAVTNGMLAKGHAFHDDFNATFKDGIFPVPLNNLPDQRVSTAMGYLGPDVRGRANLAVLCDTTARRVVFENNRAVGVEVSSQGRVVVIKGDQTVVSGGAIHSPTLLMRSGIGPAQHLQDKGIAVVADRPGVGQNLQNHAMIHIATHLRSNAAQHKDVSSWAFTCLRYSSGVEGCSPGDMQLFPINRTAWHPLGRRIGAMGLCLYQPQSRGELTLGETADDYPDIRFNMLADKRDVERLADGLRMALDLLSDPQVKPFHNEVFLPDKALAGRLASLTTLNLVKTAILTLAFDLGGVARRAMLGKAVLDAERLANRDALLEFVETNTTHVHHVCGTCRIGRPDDQLAVVDSSGRVHEVTGLRVADASIMPRNVSANTHLVAIMIGEKIAAVIRSEKTA